MINQWKQENGWSNDNDTTFKADQIQRNSAEKKHTHTHNWYGSVTASSAPYHWASIV